MKKTLTVNLGGTVFHIDEDAYQLLDKYLINLRYHFQKEEGSDEIMNDFELRISELFNERLRLGYHVITLEHTEEVINRMGKPEEIFGENFSKKEREEEAHPEQGTSTVKKKLFRNPDDSILGGVMSGFAAYVDWDPTAIRLIFILLNIVFTFFFGIIFYLILWIIIPSANTATKKLQMRGENVTVENIGKTVTGGFERNDNDTNDFTHSDSSRSGVKKAGDGVVSVLGVIIKVLGILAAIVLLPPVLFVLFILLVILFACVIALIGGSVGLLGGSIASLFGFLPFVDLGLVNSYPEAALIIATIVSILLIGIPLIAFGYLIVGKIFKWKPMPHSAKWILLILWFVSLITMIILVVNYGMANVWTE